MHLRAQQVLFLVLAVILLAGECGCHGLRLQPQRTLLQGSSSSTASGGTGGSAATSSNAPGSASASSTASSTGGTSTASASATPGGSSTSARVSPSPSPPPPRRSPSPSPSPVPAPSRSEVEVNATLNETFVAIYLSIEERLDDGEDAKIATRDEVTGSRFKIATIWGRVLGEVDGVDCQDEAALVEAQAKDFAQALASGLLEAKGSLQNADEIVETVAELMEPAFVDAVEAACGVAGFSVGPEFMFALRLVDPVTEGYLLAGVGGEKAAGSRPRSLPSPDETSSSSASTSMSADGETSSSSSTSTNGGTTTSTSTTTSGTGTATASASGTASASATGTGSSSGGSTQTNTSTTTTTTSTTISRPSSTPPPAEQNVVTSNGSGDDVCAGKFTACCLQRKILSGKCDCVFDRCDATYVDGMWEDVSGVVCTCP
eukprot:evm.model.scf_2660.1 EVM.evm.TU.scf_2660.1   scf_2660:4808-7910(+)